MENLSVHETQIRSVRAAIDWMAHTQGQAVFIISPETGGALTFAGLKEQSIAVASWFQKAGLQRGDKIAVLMDNGLFTVQLFLGTMYAGLVSVPLDVRAGAAQLASTLDHCDAQMLFIEDQYKAIAEQAISRISRAVEVVTADLDSFANEIVAPPDDLPSAALEGEEPALLMYTSGSVGQPKAAIHSHRTLLAHGRNSVLAHNLSRADRSLLVLPIYHINAECVTLMPTLISGGSVVVPHRFNVSEFWDWLSDYHCTWSALVPTIIAQLLDWKDPRAETRKSALKRIRFLRSSSAPLSPSLHREFLNKFQLLLIQAMGSTETGNIFSNPLPPGENKIGSPGLAWGFETRIIDLAGADLPTGDSGEVLLRGPAIMQGYYKDADLTATVLDAEGWLHTGDLAYRDQDGYFFVVGRSKEVIIKSGVNIAPQQIDETLEAHPSVLEAAVVGVPDRYVGEDLVAFAVLRTGMQGDEREMLSFCESRLGHFKTPTRIHFVADLPKGPSGKVQRLHLLDHHANLAAVGASNNNCDAAQRTESRPFSVIEQTIAESWVELLGQVQIDPDSNFFALGGHSLMAIRCLSKLREKLPVALSLSDFFENPTVLQQAALVSRRLNEPSGTVGSLVTRRSLPVDDQIAPRLIEETSRQRPITPRARTSPYPLSPGQRRIWFFRELAPEVPLYNESEAVRLRGELGIDAMQQALDAIIARHEVLRTTFSRTEEGVMANVHESWPLRIKQIDLSSLAAEQREAEVERLLIDEPRRLYDLEAEPAIRVTLLRLGAREHVFMLMMHHIICDRWSMGIVSRELAALYQAFVCGNTPALPALPIQNGDYVVWQLQRADGDFAEELAYWEENLRGAPDLLQLPTDRPRPSVQSYRGARRRFWLNAALAEGLRNRSRQEKTSLFNIFTAALNVLLYRYTGSEDLVIGIPVADRDRQEAQSLIGFLIDTHALRTTLSGDITFRELLARVQTGLVGLYSHREIPFDQVVSRIRPARDLSHSPLFQVMINCRDRAMQLMFIGLPDLEVESLLPHNKTSKFDFTIYPFDNGADISLEVEYNTDLFDEQRILRMVGHYQTLLEAVVADPDQCLAKLALLTGAERRQLLVDWNRTEANYPKQLCVHQLFERQVERDPDAVAVVYQDQSLSYGELNARCNRLAHHLRRLGVGPDVLVAICVERSLEMVMGLLAILKAGGAYVPLDPSYPSERLAFLMQDSAPAVILSCAPARAALETAVAGLTKRPPILDLEADAPLWAEQPDTNPEPEAVGLTPSHLVYVIYTSGSTGTPKGVLTEHRALFNRLQWMQNAYGLTAGDTVLQKTPFSFDVSVWEFFWPLGWGAKLAVAAPGIHRDPARLVQVIDEQRVTTAHFVPSMLRSFLEHLVANRCGTLTRVICSGEALPLPLLEKFHEILDRADLHNLYGPTEAAIDVTAWTSTGQLAAEAASPPIGRPISNTRIYLLDKSQEPVPVGVAGEINIGGAGVARGYLNRTQLTAERFIPSPFVEGDRLYKTGDLGRYLADGNIEFLGRNDFQVKIRGCRIELGEIEARLSLYPGVHEAVVLAREDATGDKRLVAYYAAAGSGETGAEVLRSHLAATLPEYMVPAAFVRLEKLPLTSNGKIDRSALPAPDAGACATQVYEAPLGPVETAIAEIWAEVLSIDRVGRHDNFFDLGGNSLRLVRLLVEVNRSFSRQLPLAMIYDAPTIAALASILNSTTAPQFSPIVSLKSGKTFPPLFIVCSSAGISMELTALAECLSGDHQIYALEAIGLDGISKPYQRVEDMAGYYLNHIRELQPSGPYLLAGLSFGGLVALEIGQRLLGNGEDVALLAFLDTTPDPQLLPLSFLLAHWKRSIYEHAAVLPQLPMLKIAPYVLKRLIGIREPIRARYFGGYRWKQSRLDRGGPLPDVVRAVQDGADTARRCYRPRFYPRTITLLKAEKTGGLWQTYAAFWAKLATKIDVHIVPGDHMNMITTHAESFGAELSLCIERALRSEHCGRSAAVPSEYCATATSRSRRKRTTLS